MCIILHIKDDFAYTYLIHFDIINSMESLDIEIANLINKHYLTPT